LPPDHSPPEASGQQIGGVLSGFARHRMLARFARGNRKSTSGVKTFSVRGTPTAQVRHALLACEESAS
jgi:hypothetical protein